MLPSVDVLGVRIDLRRFTLAVVVSLCFVGVVFAFETRVSVILISLMALASLWFFAGAIKGIHDTHGYRIALGLLFTGFGGVGYLRGEQTLITYTFLFGGSILVIAEALGIDLRLSNFYQ
ncbi:hypothetical protein [Haladaptatus sp. CMAA 1911]|uniref:hypothetical protein n=1 Tax=unclassified Haladaptatus TaxID=2622732 RepID=UPI00375492C8